MLIDRFWCLQVAFPTALGHCQLLCPESPGELVKASHPLCLQRGGSCALPGFVLSFLFRLWAAGKSFCPSQHWEQGQSAMAELTQEGAGGTLAALCEVKGNAQGVFAARIDHACSCGKLRSDALEQGFLYW